jgi:hypothetical protein
MKPFQPLLLFALVAILPALALGGAYKQASFDNETQGRVRPADSRALAALNGLLRNSADFSISDVIIRRVEEWFAHAPFNSDFSVIIKERSIVEKLANYVVKGEKGFSPTKWPRPSATLLHSLNKNVTTVEFLPGSRFRGIDVA